MDDSEAMDRAIALASAVRTTTSPNPWVGCVVLATDGAVFEGATHPPGGPHAEAAALAAAGPRARGATVVATLDGRTAAGDGTSQWITGPEARADAHRLRAESDAVLVGAGTVRADDPSLTVRHVATPEDRQPLRVVLGHVAESAKVQPALELTGDLGEVLDTLGDKGVLQVLVEGGPTVAGAFHRAGLVDRYVVYLAPALTGGDDGRPLFTGPGTPSIDDLWRGRIVGVTQVGDDIRVDVQASGSA